MKRQLLAASVSLAVAAPGAAEAVYLDPEGLGQALIYPYYTVRSSAGNPFNTFVSIVNHEAVAKVLRVRFREGRNGRAVANFNLYLSAHDMWTAAVVATGDGAKLVTGDQSCVNPAFAVSGSQRELAFSSAPFSGANADGAGEGGDRTREGYVEVIEMATLSGTSANAVTHTPSGTPENCAVVQDPAFPHTVNAPSGGLSGSATLINVASGLDFTFNAEALAELTTEPFYRHFGDDYPDWNAPEVTPVSFFSTQGTLYRFDWLRGADAVSSVLMRSAIENEFLLDASTRSETDWVITFPTRRFYATTTESAPPFSAGLDAGKVCERLTLTAHSREEQTETLRSTDFSALVPEVACWAANVLELRSNASTTRQLASANSMAMIPPSFANGWIGLTFAASGTQNPGMRSLVSSWARLLDGEAVQPGVYEIRGLPVVGFMVRTFENGTLSCSATSCQGNYGGAFTHRVRRSVTRAP